MILIYRIDFPDGSAYVGQTSRSLDARMHGHRVDAKRGKRCNRGLEHAVLRYGTGGARVLRLCSSPADANARECEAILDLREAVGTRCLNVSNGPTSDWGGYEGRTDAGSGTGRARGRRKPRADDRAVFRCSVCRRRKHATEFHSDRSRYNGLMSKCTACSAALAGLCGKEYQAVKAGLRDAGPAS